MANYFHAIERMAMRPDVAIRPRRGLTNRANPLENLDEVEFRSRYRLSKETVLDVCDLVKDDLERDTKRNHALPVHVQVLTALRFYGAGAFQILHGDEAGLSQGTVCRILKSVAGALASRRADYIKFPNTNAEIRTTQQGFFEYSNFPGVIGAIDGTHIPINNPGGDYGLYFLNRKNRYSINVQAVCNHQGIITNIVARWPGSAHDSRIFNESSLKLKLEDHRYENCWLLGDSGYACQPYLMTPLLNPQRQDEINYNRAHKRGRNIIERTFGMMKRRFFCLKGLRLKLENVLTTIVAVSVLWNISIIHREPDIAGPDVDEIPGDDHPHHGPGNGHLRRQMLIRDHFGV